MDRTIVQFSRGADDEMIWFPCVSFQVIRLGTRRFQKRPVHDRWELARIVPEEERTPEAVKEAEAHRDSAVV